MCGSTTSNTWSGIDSYSYRKRIIWVYNTFTLSFTDTYTGAIS